MTRAAGQLVPLNLLQVGETGRIGLLTGAAEHVHRLEEMGLRVGVTVQMVDPGRPCIVRLGEQKLCFRADEMLSVLVNVEDGS